VAPRSNRTRLKAAAVVSLATVLLRSVLAAPLKAAANKVENSAARVEVALTLSANTSKESRRTAARFGHLDFISALTSFPSRLPLVVAQCC
jgi:hypothetical protein